MSGELLLYLLIALIGLTLSALFSGLETGLYTINRVRLAVLAERSDRRARRLLAFIRSPNRMLSTLLIGNNIANYLGSFGLAAILDLYGVTPVSAIVINAAVLVPMLFIFGETLPKDLFRTHTDRWSYSFAGFLTWVARLLTWIGLVPLVHAFGAAVTRLASGGKRGAADDASLDDEARQRISHLIKEGEGAGVLSEAQSSLADRALALREVRVGGEMVPWARVVTIRENADENERQSLLRRQPHTRVPVVDASGRVVGVVSIIEAALEPRTPLTSLMQKPVELDPAMPVRDGLRAMRGRCPMAIVIHPRTRAPIGIVTLKDLVEPLTGELAAW